MKTIFISLLCAMVTFSSCEKYLDVKPDTSLTTPETLEDLQMILDYAGLTKSYPYEISMLEDNYYLQPSVWNALSETDRNLCTWMKDDNINGAWKSFYSANLYVNVVLESLEKISIKENESEIVGTIEGSAKFFRGYGLFALAQLHTIPYNTEDLDLKLGLPLRLSADFNKETTRSTLRMTYGQILADLKEAVRLLPENTLLPTRPKKAAAFGALAKVYLVMQDYNNASKYADSCLQLHHSLMDYNTINSNSNIPFNRFNEEVIFHGISNFNSLSPSRAIIDSTLYLSYNDHDLRKKLFFKMSKDSTYSFKGDYDQKGSSNFVFWGITTDETYLIRAECNARMGNIKEAMEDVNRLLKNRYEHGQFKEVNFAGRDESIDYILEERRKELLFRGTRWMDLRRLMDDPMRAIIPERKIGDVLYNLPINSSRYTLQIPKLVMDQTNINQNP